MSSFRSAAECREVMDRAFGLMSADPGMGPKLRDAHTPQRFEFPDLGLVVNVAGADEQGDSEHNLVWEWTDDVGWEADVRMTMESEVANRYFQGAENLTMAIARRRIRAAGNVAKALAMVPMTKPVFPLYRRMLEAEYPHLVVTREEGRGRLAATLCVDRSALAEVHKTKWGRTKSRPSRFPRP